MDKDIYIITCYMCGKKFDKKIGKYVKDDTKSHGYGLCDDCKRYKSWEMITYG